GRRPEHRIRDRDAVYGGALRERAEALRVETVRTPVRAPRANAVAERVLGTLRREGLDHVLPLTDAHDRTLRADHAGDGNTERPHRPRPPETPRPAARSPAGAVRGRCSGACTTRTRAPREGG